MIVREIRSGCEPADLALSHKHIASFVQPFSQFLLSFLRFAEPRIWFRRLWPSLTFGHTLKPYFLVRPFCGHWCEYSASILLVTSLNNVNFDLDSRTPTQ